MTTSNAATEPRYTFANLNDSQKQTLVDNLLLVHPLRLNNTIVEYILSQDDYDNAPFTREDITNNTAYGQVELDNSWEELTEEERDAKVAELEDQLYDLELEGSYEDLEGESEELHDKLTQDLQNLNDMHFDEYPEIYQWFSCSDWLIRELEEKGQCTLDGEFWGRQCCGQSVVLDHVMQAIAFEYACDYSKDTLSAAQFYTISR